jgi:hypothetical protein
LAAVVAVVVAWRRPKHGEAVVVALAVAMVALVTPQDMGSLSPVVLEAALVELVGTVFHTGTLHQLEGLLAAAAVAGSSMALAKNKMAGPRAQAAGASSRVSVVLALATAVVQVALVILVVETLTAPSEQAVVAAGALRVEPLLGLLVVPEALRSGKMETLYFSLTAQLVGFGVV